VLHQKPKGKNLLIIILVLMATTMLILIIFSSFTGMAQYVTYTSNYINGSISNSSIPSRAWAPNGSISGYILDINGNRVPQAFITLSKDGKIVNDHEVFSADGVNGSIGEYGFTGLDSGNYTVTAEKADGQLFYNGTASVTLIGDVSIKLDVAINNYVFRPWITPTPAPTIAPKVTEAPEPTALPTATPSAPGLLGSFNLLYVLAIIPLAIVGILFVIRSRKRPLKSSAVQKSVTKAPGSSVQMINNKGISINGKTKANYGVSKLLNENAEYRMEIEELIKKNTASGYTDIAVINKVNELAKKYGIDQNTIFYDMRTMKSKNK